jgi:hypothetical protein
MSIFGSFKKVVGAAAGEVQAQSNENKRRSRSLLRRRGADGDG